MKYKFKPIIIEGVNHSGTRVLVEILSHLGSDGGDYHNIWHENEFFLNIHKTLIDKISDRGWTKTILDVSFIRQYEDKCEFKGFILNKLKNELHLHYPDHEKKPWHWKCPTSALFEKTWCEIFPDAYYIILHRDPAHVAKAFVRRNASLSFRSGLEFYGIMESKIKSISKRNQLDLTYENLENEVEKIANFLPFEITTERISKAKSIIKSPKELKFRDKSLRMYYKQIKADIAYSLYRKGIIT